MDLCILADSHFDHEKFSNEGLRPIGFSEKIFKNLERILRPESILLHLGDVCFKNDNKWHSKIASLPGKKWLILGNHDKKSIIWYLNHGWDLVCETMSLNIFGKRILFSHKPEINDRYDLNIHGHFHDYKIEIIKEREPEIFKILNNRHYLISLEKLKYEPIKLKSIIETVNKHGELA